MLFSVEWKQKQFIAKKVICMLVVSMVIVCKNMSNSMGNHSLCFLVGPGPEWYL